jgi:magnesium-transporting ATPase (P-type)
MAIDLNKLKVISLTLLVVSSIVYVLSATGILLLFGFKLYFDPLQLTIDSQIIKIAYAIALPIFVANVWLSNAAKEIPEFRLKSDRWGWLFNLGVLAFVFAFASTFIFPPMEIGLSADRSLAAVDVATLSIEAKQQLWKNCLRACLIIFGLMSTNVRILLNFVRPIDSKAVV